VSRPRPHRPFPKRPFVGRAGRTLDALLREAGLTRSEAYVTNTVLCRPTQPANKGRLRDRPPTEAEIAACLPWLDAQLRGATPRVIVTLGATPLRRLLGPSHRVERDRGRVFRGSGAYVVPTYHPAAIRWGAGRREAVVTDLRTARALLDTTGVPPSGRWITQSGPVRD
jgi:uracil-DNA glycosylase family 4